MRLRECMNIIKLTGRILKLKESRNIIDSSPKSIKIVFCAGGIVDYMVLNKKSILFIHDGIVSLNRKYDKKLLQHVIEPFPFGIIQSSIQNVNYYLYCESDASFNLIDSDEFNSLADDCNEWKWNSKIICHLIDLVDEAQKSGYLKYTNYDIVRTVFSKYGNSLTIQEKRRPYSHRFFLDTIYHEVRWLDLSKH